MMDKNISNFHTSFYIPENHKLAFHLPHVHILGTNHYGEYHGTLFKHRRSFQYVLCRNDYSMSVAASFPHETQSEYIYVY